MAQFLGSRSSQIVGKTMRDIGDGSIINVAPVDGSRPEVGAGFYAISKAGVIMLTKVLAQEWGQYNIRVNVIAPGIIKTRFSEVLWSDSATHKVNEDSIALGRIGGAEEIAGSALFLASEASSYMTGQSIIMDGGHFPRIKTFLPTITGGEKD